MTQTATPLPVPLLPLPAIDRSLVTTELTQRAAGAIIGSAVGDALGAPFEFGPAGKYTARFPQPVIGGTGEMVGGGPWSPGEFTDDTQMAIVQAESLLACGGLDEADLFARFRAWSSTAKDVGIQTRAVLGSTLAGSAAATEHYGRTGMAAGNGSLMRATPTAVLLATGSEADAIEFARATSAVTHGDPAAGWGTAIFAVLVRAALRGDDPWAALGRILAELPDDQSLYRTILAADWSPERGMQAPNGPELADGPELPNGTVWTCLAQAVWAVRSTDSFAGAVIAAIDLGGDTDTVAAVTGGLAGAVHGIASVPSRWSTYLNGTLTTPDGQVDYALDDLRDLTARVLGNTHRRHTRVDGEILALDGPVNLTADDLRALLAAAEAKGRHPDLVIGHGPTEIAPGLHAANLNGATTVPEDWAVMSLCLVGDVFADHPVRREIHLVDKDPDGPDGTGDHNIGLADAVDDAVASIDAFLAEGRPVVVHCHGGASRTGLVLRAWLMQANGWTDEEAIEHIRSRWPHLALWSRSFTAHLANR